MLNLLSKIPTLTPIDVFIRTDHIKKTLLLSEGLAWTDLMVICELNRLNDKERITIPELVTNLALSRCWVYRSIRKLNSKKLVLVNSRFKQLSLVSLSNWGRILLQRAGEAFLLYDEATFNTSS